MGYRFNLQHINWLSALIDPYRMPSISDIPQFREAIREVFAQGETRFMSSMRYEHEFRMELMELLHSIENVPNCHLDCPDLSSYQEAEYYWRRNWLRWQHLHARFFFRPWTACIIPSGDDERLDRELCAPGLLRFLVDDHPEHPGLILQPSEAPRNHFALLDAIPAISHALNNIGRWPLLLVWSGNEVALLPIGRNPNEVLDRMRLGLGMLYGGVPLEDLEDEFRDRVESKRDAEPVHIVQLSDVHIGSNEASKRLRHLGHVVRNLRSELGPRTIPVISGDLFDTPKPSLKDDVMTFVDEVGRTIGERPFCVVGNHDVRGGIGGGWGDAHPGPMMETHLCQPLRVYENYGISLMGFNSCEGGDLARGEITEGQLYDRNRRIDEEAVGMRIGVVHHHPMRVDHPDWELRPFWKRWIEPLHAPTVEMVNGGDLLTFCQAKEIGTVIHGHKHIPHFVQSGGVRVVGCGSSVGKIETKDRAPYISVNVLTIFPDSNRVITRLLADRTHAGLQEQTRHEFVALS